MLPSIHPKANPTWKVIGAAVQGTSHQKSGLPCQDFQGSQLLPGGTLLVALADGAGSAELADQGARCAVDTALTALSSGLEAGKPSDEAAWAGMIYSAYEQTRTALQQLSDEVDVPLRDLATTLICVILDGDWLAAGQLGDGAVIAQLAGEDLIAITQAQRGEYANETYFLTQDTALERVEIYILNHPVSALAVMSDGLTRLALKLPEDKPHLPFFQPLFAFASAVDGQPQAEEQLAAFLDSPRVCARTDDDKSLVVAILDRSNSTETVDETPGQRSAQAESEENWLPENT